MLVLTRKQHEKIVIGDNIHLTIVAVRGNRVQLGIDAPHETPVLRSELVAQDSAIIGNESRELVLSTD